MRLGILLFCVLVGCGLPGATTEPLQAGGHHVLFIGNSLTYTNDLPGTVSQLANAVGDTIHVRAIALPNYALIDHVSGGSSAVDAIKGERWSMVVLQQGPSTLPVNRDTLVLATQRLDPFIKAAGAVSAQYSVWPTLDRPQDFPAVLASSQAAARAVGGVVLAAGQAWTAAWAIDRTLLLYGPDGFHQGELGTYLAALVIYEGITCHDAQRLPSRAVVAGRELAVPESTVRMLQRVAHETVVQYRAP